MGSRDEELKEILMEKKRRLWNELRVELFENLGAQSNAQYENALDDGDRSLLDVIGDTGLSVADSRKEELSHLEEAERKLKEGSYGVCEDCGEEIPTERVKVVPDAIYCVSCQEKHEGPQFAPHATM
ncbi:TraR/DksA family transcriptional regulator [Geotalea toluenoxydans]|uniref:TraR/DksA family transcriptional regulator n=1 Tax=Geotalea toluenoxydans TaxID=421624 RepID=UPI0006D0E1D3|nr:TraR/DksA family transcriptional regulator [Geotalea toluenoxydans]